MKRVLITGGAGFIGSAMAEKLAHDGHRIIIVDNLFRGRMENIQSVVNAGHAFEKLDMAAHESIHQLADLVDRHRPDWILHYAAINGTQFFYDQPALVSEVNSIATYHLMLALKNVCKNFKDYRPLIYFASTSEVYGEPEKVPTVESDKSYVRIEEDRDSYAAAKLMSEFYVRLFCKEIGLPYLIGRIFNVFGPKMIGSKYGQVVPEFISRLLQGEYPLNIIGDGKHTRSFCYISDHIELTLKALESPLRNTVVNIGNPHEISIQELATLIMQRLGLAPRFAYQTERSGDHRRRCPDISYLIKTIGPYEFVSLSSALDLTIAYYRSAVKTDQA